jgi:hypothetical protein
MLQVRRSEARDEKGSVMPSRDLNLEPGLIETPRLPLLPVLFAALTALNVASAVLALLAA